MFAGLAIGASRTGDPVWLLAGAALALQTTRHAIDFSFPASQHQVIAAAPQPPIENPFDGPRPASRMTEPVEAEEVEEEDAQAPVAPAPAQMTLRRRLGRLWRAGDRNPQIRWLKKIIAFPIGERFAAISITAALFDAQTDVHRAARVGRLRLGLRPGRPHPAVAAVMTAATATAAAGPHRPRRACSRSTATTARSPRRSAARSAASLPLPAIALLLVAGLPLLVAIVLEGDGASHGLVAAVIAWAVLLGGARERPPAHRPPALDWCRPRCARSSTAGCCGSAPWPGDDALPATFALLCAITYHHYEAVYGLRHRGVSAAGLGRARSPAAGTGGCVLGVVLLLAGALPAGFYVLAALLAVLFVGETVAEWRRFHAGQQPVYDDEEDEAD